MFFTNYVRVVAMKRGKLEKWAAAPLSEGLVGAGLIREPRALGVVIDNLFKTLKMKRNHVIFTVTGLPFIYRTVTMPAGQRIPAEAIERESRREMSLGEKDMYLTWQFTETRQTTHEADYFVLGVPRTALNPLVEAVAQSGIKQYNIDIKPLALARVAGLKQALIISFEADNIDVVVIANGLVRVIHSFNPLDQSKDSIASVAEIANGLNRAIKSFERDFPDLSLPAETPVLISGKFLPEDPFLSLLQEASGRGVRLITSSLNVPSGMPVGVYSTGLGLICNKMSHQSSQAYHDINLDLLHGITRLHTRKFQTAWILAAVLSLALAVLVYESHGLRVNAAEEVATLQQQAEEMNRLLLEARNVNQQTLVARQAAAEKAKTSEQQLAEINRTIGLIDSQRIDYGSHIAAISDVVPPGAAIISMDFQSHTIKVSGQAIDGFEVLKLADALEKNSYFYSVRVEQLTPAEGTGVDFQLLISIRNGRAILSAPPAN